MRHIKIEKAKCIECGKILSIKGGSTGAIRGHMQTVHKVEVTKSIHGCEVTYESKDDKNYDYEKSSDEIDYFRYEEADYENFKKNDSANPIWDYFLQHINGELAKCTNCDRILSVKGGSTGTMRNHMKNVHLMKVVTKASYTP